MTMSEYLQPSVLGVATATLSVVRAVAKKVTYSRTEGRKKKCKYVEVVGKVL